MRSVKFVLTFLFEAVAGSFSKLTNMLGSIVLPEIGAKLPFLVNLTGPRWVVCKVEVDIYLLVGECILVTSF